MQQLPEADSAGREDVFGGVLWGDYGGIPLAGMSRIHSRLKLRLNQWGLWHIRFFLASGLPPVTILARILEEGHVSRSEAGSVVLCPDMRDALWEVHWGIQRLPEALRQVVRARYWLDVESGRSWTNRERAQELGISHQLFKQRLRIAHRRIEPLI